MERYHRGIGAPGFFQKDVSKGVPCGAALALTIHYSPFTIYGFFVGKLLVTRDPENLTREFHKVDRRGRILVDTGRNDYSAMFAAAYTVRARPGASISAPCTWRR